MKLTDIIKSSIKGIAKGLVVTHAATTFYYRVDEWWPSPLSEKLEDHIERFFLFTTTLTIAGSYAIASFYCPKPYFTIPAATQLVDFIAEKNYRKNLKKTF